MDYYIYIYIGLGTYGIINIYSCAVFKVHQIVTVGVCSCYATSTTTSTLPPYRACKVIVIELGPAPEREGVETFKTCNNNNNWQSNERRGWTECVSLSG